MARDEIERLCALSDGCNLISLMLDFKTLEGACEAAVRGDLQQDMRAIAEECGLSVHDGCGDDACGSDDACEKPGGVGEMPGSVGEMLGDVASIRSSVRLQRALETLDGYRGSDLREVWTSVRREHTRLFDDPDRPAVPYYEGTFVNRAFEERDMEAPDVSSLFINQAAMDADRQYKRAGAVKATSENVPGDSMFVEMAFLGMLLGRKAAELSRAPGAAGDGLPVRARTIPDDETRPKGMPPAARSVDDMIDEFLHLHMRAWARAFFDELADQAREPYFSALAAFGALVTDRLRDLRPEAFDSRRLA